MQRAFLKVEAALLDRIATNAAHNITEETVRDALFNGLLETEPNLQNHVTTEWPVPWGDVQCVSCNETPGAGRKKAHDVAVKSFLNNDGSRNHGLVCEAKWMKITKAGKMPDRVNELVDDVIRLALTRAQARQTQAIRVFLLIGGESKPFGTALSGLQARKVNLRWSPAGKQDSHDLVPEDKVFNLRTFLTRQAQGKDEFEDLMKFKATHFRNPPDIWSKLRITLRARWLQTSSRRSWRMALWELHHWGVQSKPLSGNDLAAPLRGRHP